MQSNPVFENIKNQDYQNIKSWLEKEYKVKQEDKIQYSIDSFSFMLNDKKVKTIYYNSSKLMFQSNPSKEFEQFISKLIKSFNLNIKQEYENINNEQEVSINKINFIGFDESGAGECMGSLFLGCATINKKDIAYFKGILKNRDIKKLTHQQILDLYNYFKDKFNYQILQISANYLDHNNKNLSLDEGYLDLIIKSEIINSDQINCCIVIDDYGVGYELKEKLDSLQSAGTKVIVESKADVNYVCSSLASLVARRARILEMDKLSKDNILIDPETGRKVRFDSGAPNEETKKWLETYRKIYQYDDFPLFVRQKWANVKEIDENFPKKRLDYEFKCEHKDCKKLTNSLFFYVDKYKSEIYCPNCKKLISKEYFLESLPHLKITIDTSALIDRVISKDLGSTGYLQNSKILLTSMLYEEVDSKQPDRKKGALNEINYIKKSSESGVLEFENIDVEDYRDVQNDKKFIFIVKRHGSIMLTKDRNLAQFTSLGVLVLRIIQDINQLNEYIT